jgi:DNA-binding NarL/FixJ family response regulator
MIRVVLADDHGIIRDGLGRLISALEDVELVGVAADGTEAVEQCRLTTPDVVLMDLDMPVLDGIEATRRILAERPETAVIVLTAFSDRSTRAPRARSSTHDRHRIRWPGFRLASARCSACWSKDSRTS